MQVRTWAMLMDKMISSNLSGRPSVLRVNQARAEPWTKNSFVNIMIIIIVIFHDDHQIWKHDNHPHGDDHQYLHWRNSNAQLWERCESTSLRCGEVQHHRCKSAFKWYEDILCECQNIVIHRLRHHGCRNVEPGVKLFENYLSPPLWMSRVSASLVL